MDAARTLPKITTSRINVTGSDTAATVRSSADRSFIACSVGTAPPTWVRTPGIGSRSRMDW